MPTIIYKIATRAQWNDAEAKGVFSGAPIDLEDGYIHFSTREQVMETAEKHFHGQKDLRLISVDADTLGEALVWEPSRGGALFPHLYSELAVSDTLAVQELGDRTDGGHDFPELF
ncbi:MAG: DUF952 domain-containing protein [Pseudomonadota bacterium]